VPRYWTEGQYDEGVNVRYHKEKARLRGLLARLRICGIVFDCFPCTCVDVIINPLARERLTNVGRRYE